MEGQKISTSKNWAIWIDEYMNDFPNMQDTLRYVLTTNAPENKDNDFTWKDFQAKNNNELVAIFGNLVNRVAVLTEKYYGLEIPPNGNIDNEKEKIIDQIYKYPEIIGSCIEKFKFRDAINNMIDLARYGNKFLADTEPWKLIKTSDSLKVQTIMNISIQICGILTVVCEPFLPNTSKKLKKQFNLENINWNEINKKNPIISTKIKKSDLIFRKIEDEEIDFQLRKLNASKNRIGILGCGWLGLPLAKKLIKKNFLVKGSTTSINKIDELKENDIDPYLIHIYKTKIYFI